MNFLDLIIIGVILLGGLAGYRKGLINALIGVAGSLVSLVIAFSTYKTLTPVLAERLGVGKIVGRVLSSSVSLPATKVQSIQGTGLDQLSLVTDLLPKPLQQEFNTLFLDMMKSAVSASIKTVGDAVVQYLTLVVVSMITFFLIFVLSKWILGFVGKVITKSSDRSLFGSLNHSGGFLAGVLASTLFISLVLGFLTPLFSVNMGQGVLKTLSLLAHDSVLTPYLVKLFTGLTHSLGRIFT